VLGAITLDQISELFDEKFREHSNLIDEKFREHFSNAQPVQQQPSQVPAAEELPGMDFEQELGDVAPQNYTWRDGTESRLPEGFAIPIVALSLAFQLWHCGTDAYVPLREVAASDFSLKNASKRLSDFRCIMKTIDGFVKDTEKWKPLFARKPMKVTLREANLMFAETKYSVIAALSPCGRERRGNELIWTTCVKDVLKRRKVERDEQKALDASG
jgi:hypothetical protein